MPLARIGLLFESSSGVAAPLPSISSSTSRVNTASPLQSAASLVAAGSARPSPYRRWLVASLCDSHERAHTMGFCDMSKYVSDVKWASGCAARINGSIQQPRAPWTVLCTLWSLLRLLPMSLSRILSDTSAVIELAIAATRIARQKVVR